MKRLEDSSVLTRSTHIVNLSRNRKFLTHTASVPQLDFVENKTTTITKFNVSNIPSGFTAERKKNASKLRLRVLQGRIPPFKKGYEPPCDTCKTAACCKLFVIKLTQDEYDSGIYKEYAVEFTPKLLEQFRSEMATVYAPDAPFLFLMRHDTPVHLLEGVQHVSCPFLDEDNHCSIYEDRPVTCRSYTCVGDPRITADMRESL